jgi:hypothetical protein
MMRCPGLKELADLVSKRDEQIMQLLPAWWTDEQRIASVKSFPGQVLIHTVVAIVHMELRRIEAEE